MLLNAPQGTKFEAENPCYGSLGYLQVGSDFVVDELTAQAASFRRQKPEHDSLDTLSSGNICPRGKRCKCPHSYNKLHMHNAEPYNEGAAGMHSNIPEFFEEIYCWLGSLIILSTRWCFNSRPASVSQKLHVWMPW